MPLDKRWCDVHGISHPMYEDCPKCKVILKGGTGSSAARVRVNNPPTLTNKFTLLPTDATARKGVPLYSGLVKYFPDALIEVARLSAIGNEQHNPGKPLHWDRSKSGDELDALLRHVWEAGTLDTDGVRHSTKAAWRALGNLQKELEKAHAKQTG